MASTSRSAVALQMLPNARLIELQTGDETTTADFQGKARIINFWASWCTTCRLEYPLLADRNLSQHVIGINVQDARVSKSYQSAARDLMRREGIAIPNYIDVDESLTKALGIVGLPVTIVVNRDGEIIDRHDGALTRDLLLRFNKELD